MPELVHQPVCVQQQAIGEIKATLQSHGQENQEIKGRLLTLVDMLTKSQMDLNARDADLKNELTKINTILEHERERRETYESEQDKQEERIIQIQQDITKINTNLEMVLDQQAVYKKEHTWFDKRIRKLEHVSWFVYAAGVILAGVAMVVMYLIQLSNEIMQNMDGTKNVTYHQNAHPEQHPPVKRVAK